MKKESFDFFLENAHIIIIVCLVFIDLKNKYDKK